MSKGKRNVYSAEFKAKVALASLTSGKTLSELASEYGVHPVMIANWKAALLDSASTVFEKKNKKDSGVDSERVINELHRQIGVLSAERDFLQGASDRLARRVKGLK
ncbi:MAG: transposase [Candidatus Cloacimonetes bacterium]|jgi:transposase-like protein|nr:transposase [Candidatus Cloacimonadota bacterium]